MVLHSKTNNSVGQCSITVQQYTSTAYPGDVVQDSSTLVMHTPGGVVQDSSTLILHIQGDVVQDSSTLVLHTPGDVLQDSSTLVLHTPGDAVQNSSTVAWVRCGTAVGRGVCMGPDPMFGANTHTALPAALSCILDFPVRHPWLVL